MADLKDQTHPLWQRDRATMDSLTTGDPTDLNLAELARLTIRYQGFPGARDIQADLVKVLKKWGLTEEELFARTREIHRNTPVFRGKARTASQREDWS
jgi:Protein of unknown function (DUF3288)